MKKPSYDYQAHLNAMNSDDQVLVFTSDYLSHVEGNVLTLLEGVLENLEARKHGAIKSLVNEAIWGNMHNGWCSPMDKDKWESVTL